MKKNFYIFRHGQTDKNLAEIWQGNGSDDVLNETGKAQADALGEKVSSLGFTTIYCSPLVRAVQTANRIVKKHAMECPIIIMQNLHEADFGAAEGKTFAEVNEEYGPLVAETFNPTFENWDKCFPGGESKHAVFNRVCSCLQNIAAECASSVGVVCHAGVLSALACGLELKDVSFDNCAMLHLRYDTETRKFSQVLS
jgi:probable phosphoglycerate mutase